MEEELLLFPLGRRFPKQKEIRKQWLEFCEIDEHILNAATRLCSNHFREELKKKLSKDIVLKSNAIPSVHIKKKTISEQSNSTLNEIYDNTKQKYNATDNKNVHCNVLVNTLMTDTQCTLQSCDSIQLSKCQTPPKACVSPIRTPDSATKVKRLLYVVNSEPSTPVRNGAILGSNWQTPTKTVRDPRFVNEIRTPHLDTPRKARRALQLAKWTIKQQQRKIKTLQQARNRLVARITTLTDLVKHLQQKNLLTEAAAENLQ
ncbi:uncharacterized protein, partial [Mycetomoellerius zeteki]|uniref:uncharacterized protein n=1 Tax=Mycetomoellerius zeteki TaxID=64791 RepID=UPI00084E60CA